MRMEADVAVQKIQACTTALKSLKCGELHSSDEPLYSLGDAMAFRESSYDMALDAIQQRDNDMAGEWLDMTRIAQDYITLLTQYLEQQPLSAEKIVLDSSKASEDIFDHMAEPALEEWSHMADLGIGESLMPECLNEAEELHTDPKITKTYSQKHVEESREDEFYDHLVVLDIALKRETYSNLDDRRDPVSFQELLKHESSSNRGSSSSSTDLKSSQAFEQTEFIVELSTTRVRKNLCLAPPVYPRDALFSKRTRGPSKRPSLSWAFAF